MWTRLSIPAAKFTNVPTRIFVKSIENIVAFMQIDSFANNQYQSNRMNAFVMLILKCNNNL